MTKSRLFAIAGAVSLFVGGAWQWRSDHPAAREDTRSGGQGRTHLSGFSAPGKGWLIGRRITPSLAATAKNVGNATAAEHPPGPSDIAGRGDGRFRSEGERMESGRAGPGGRRLESDTAHLAVQDDGSPPDEDAQVAIAEPGAGSKGDDSGRDVEFSTVSSFTVPDIDTMIGEVGTVSFKLRPGWESGNQDDAAFFQLGERGPRLFKDVNFLRFEFTDGTGAEVGTAIPIDDWTGGTARLVTAVWGNGRLALYVDGEPMAEKPYQGEIGVQEGTPMTVGSDYADGKAVAPAVLSDLRIFNFDLSPSDVATLASRLTAERPER